MKRHRHRIILITLIALLIVLIYWLKINSNQKQNTDIEAQNFLQEISETEISQ